MTWRDGEAERLHSSRPARAELEYKRLPFEVRAVSDSADGGWEIAGYASTFGGSPDAYGDVVAPGAFAASIATYLPKFLYQHVEPIGKTLEIREDEHGLFGRWSIVDTATGADAHKLAKAGVLDGLSIGFFAEEYAYREDGVRVLLRVDLPEVSAVAIPANRNAVVTDVKSARSFADHGQDARVAVRSWIERVRSGSEQKRTEGKSPFTDERKALVAEMSGSLRSAADELDALVNGAAAATTTTAARPGPHEGGRSAPYAPSWDPPEPRSYDLDALRARLARLGVFEAPGSDPT